MPRARSIGRAAASPAGVVIATGLVLAVLYIARDVLIPLALAVLLSFLLAPVVMRLQRLGLPRVVAVLCTVVLASVVIGGVGVIAAAQLVDLAMSLPAYRENISAKLEPLKGTTGGVFSRTRETLKELQEELEVDATGTSVAVQEATDPDEPPPPVPVQVVASEMRPIEFIQTALLPLIRPVVTGGIVIVFAIFFLYRREDLRDRILRLLGTEQLRTSTAALDDAAGRVSRYLLMMGLINGGMGLCLGIGLYIIGVPNPALWGFLSATLRFIPYVGAWTAAVLPITVSIAVSPGWTEPLMVLGLILVLELVSNNVVEPWLYGSGTGISMVAVLLGAVFWTWLWGPIGLLLATPLTVCMVVIGRHVPNMEFLNILLSDEPALSPAEHLYQRLLALDEVDAASFVERYMEDHSLIEYADEVLIPALSLAEHDRHRGRINEEQAAFIHRSMRELADEIGSEVELAQLAEHPNSVAPVNGEGEESTSDVLCLPARDEADEIVAHVVARLLRMRGISAEAVSVTATLGERVERVAHREATVACISALPPFEIVHARSMCKRLRSRFDSLGIIVGLWGSEADQNRVRDRLGVKCCDGISPRVAQVLDMLVERAESAAAQARAAASSPTLSPLVKQEHSVS